MDKKNSTAISEKRKAEYKATYDRLMARAVGRKYQSGTHERHHIVPRSLGGSSDKSNIVCLTYREHFLAHWLLTKFTYGLEQRKMFNALWKMARNGLDNYCRIVSGWQYCIARSAFAKFNKGNKFSKGKKNAKGHKDNAEQIESKRKRSNGKNNPRCKPIRCLNDGNKFDYMLEAAKFYRIGMQSIRAVCQGKKECTITGLRFEYRNKAA